MAYTSHDWYEQAGTASERAGWLNNLETIYDEAITYLSGITHASTYYTKTECDAKYFTSVNDGTGSGIVCKTLDGYTCEQIISAGTPAGCIAMWNGSEETIPSGWYLCDGLNSTPNLQDKFIVCAGGNYSYGDSGGIDTVTTTATIGVGSHALSLAEIPKHTHTLTDNYNTISLYFYGINYATTRKGISDASRTTGTVGSGSTHTHTATFSGTENQDKRPAYYALCFIMKALV